MNALHGRTKLPLRERLEWLLIAINSGHFGPFASTRNTKLVEAYMVATLTGMVKTRHGARCFAIYEDLNELAERGQVLRSQMNTTLRREGEPTWYYVYTLTPLGEVEAKAIAARKKKQSATVALPTTN
jgi:hypothetical protein